MTCTRARACELTERGPLRPAAGRARVKLRAVSAHVYGGQWPAGVMSEHGVLGVS